MTAMSQSVLRISIPAVLALSTPAFAQIPQPPPAIVTTGEAVIKRAPDRAWITVSTEVRENKAVDARTKSAEIMTALIAALKATGLAADAIKTTGYSLTPEMSWSNGVSTIKGYVVRNQVEVRVDDIDKVSDVIDAANSPKNAGLSIVGPRFDLKSPKDAETEALKAAVDIAMARAQAMASAARRSLGPILRLETSQVGMSTPGPRPMMLAQPARAGAGFGGPETPITPGEIEVRAVVMLTVTIQS